MSAPERSVKASAEPVRAVVSLGTNSTRFLVIRDVGGGRVEQLDRGSIGTRLGEGLGADNGTLTSDAMRRTLDAIDQFMQRIRTHGARVSAIATSAMRRASNGEDFARRVTARTGAPLRILHGDEEAAASFLGATHAMQGDLRVGVLDVGGGSTECAVGKPRHMERATSLEVGAVRLAERFPETLGGDNANEARGAAIRARAAADEILRELGAFGPVDEVAAVGGTPLTIGAIVFASDVDAVAGRRIDAPTLQKSVDRMLKLPLDERRQLPGMLPQRADILPAGGLILLAAMALLRVDALRLEADDLLLGHLLQTGPSEFAAER